MEILFVSHKYPPAVGGMEKQSFELINGMEQYCKVHRIVFDGRGSILSFFASLEKRIVALCKQHPGIRVIHYNDGLLAAICVWHKGYPHLKRTVTLHGLDVVFPSKTYHKRILPKFNAFDKMIAVSQATADRAIALGLDAAKIVVVKNGVDTNLPGSPSTNITQLLDGHGIEYKGQRVLVSMGRPVKRKGMSWFIENVVPKLKGEYLFLLIGAFKTTPDNTEKLLSFLPASLNSKIALFLGFPTDNAPLRKLLKDPKFTPNVKHLGKLPTEEVQSLLASSDAFIMPNISLEGDMEGFGLVCLEAAIAGATVFASNIDGIPDAVQDGKNGYLLPSGDANAWADRLNALLSSPKRERDSAFRDFTIAHYSWDNMVKSYFEIFKTI